MEIAEGGEEVGRRRGRVERRWIGGGGGWRGGEEMDWGRMERRWIGGRGGWGGDGLVWSWFEGRVKVGKKGREEERAGVRGR